jgi:hypothetical protein
VVHCAFLVRSASHDHPTVDPGVDPAFRYVNREHVDTPRPPRHQGVGRVLIEQQVCSMLRFYWFATQTLTSNGGGVAMAHRVCGLDKTWCSAAKVYAKRCWVIQEQLHRVCPDHCGRDFSPPPQHAVHARQARVNMAFSRSEPSIVLKQYK